MVVSRGLERRLPMSDEFNFNDLASGNIRRGEVVAALLRIVHAGYSSSSDTAAVNARALLENLEGYAKKVEDALEFTEEQ
jgi:hypothetical protein